MGGEETSVISHDVRETTRPDRNLALELVRVTEAAALAAARWVGKGAKEEADQAAVDAMRLMLDTVPMDGIVVIGEGEKDEAPMLYNGERIEAGDVTLIVLDRPRHEEAVKGVREVGARIRFITDGDVSAALFAVSQGTGVDLLWGIGGTPEGVLSAAAIKCLGGELLGRLWPRDDEERRAAIDAGYDLDEVMDSNRLVSGIDVFFAATGVTDGDLLQGVRYLDDGYAHPESLVMC